MNSLAKENSPALVEAAETGTLFNSLQREYKHRRINLDAAQLQALSHFQHLYDELWQFRKARRSLLRRWLNPPAVPRGLYLWGGVGRGKSFLLDSFYAQAPLRRKTRIHFHAFMQNVHEELKTLVREEDPLRSVARRISRRYRIICFDEFHVSDIADAMILGRLLEFLLTGGVVFCATSNYHPDQLYPHGLQRQNFLPTIELIKNRLNIVEIAAGVDYRLRALEHTQSYFTPLTAEVDQQLEEIFSELTMGGTDKSKLLIAGRALPVRKRAGGVAWFDFSALCGGPRSANDYLELARCFNTVIVSDVPRLTSEQADQARRFTWLVDVFYDHRVKLLVSAAVPAEELYRAGPNSHEFGRTVSRLIEMRTHDYMMQGHITT